MPKQVVIRPVYATKKALEECFGLLVDIRDGDSRKTTKVLLPSTLAPREVAKELRNLARWVELESK